MFEVMWNYKTWDMFEKWFLKKYKMYPHQTEKDFVLFTIPFFMDEYNINLIPSEKQCFVFYPRKDNPELEHGIPYKGNNRQEALIKACETAFEILESKYEK